MTIEEAKELKKGDRIKFPSGNVYEVADVVERGIVIFTSDGHKALFEWIALTTKSVEKL